jgi:hypothetical protein
MTGRSDSATIIAGMRAATVVGLARYTLGGQECALSSGRVPLIGIL